MLLQGDCLVKLKELDDNSVDSIVTDPPYGLSFMGKKWDYDVPSKEIWIEALRVLKPGGHLLAFGGTRTYHRLVVNIEDAGFEIRDQIQWLYGSGFPKSLDVSKAIDKEAGAEREVVSVKVSKSGGMAHIMKTNKSHGYRPGDYYEDVGNVIKHTAPATPEAKKWQGWGTALKPANEPICVARKPLEKGLTVAQNVLKWGTGAINVDESRIEFSCNDDTRIGKGYSHKASPGLNIGSKDNSNGEFQILHNPQGRWPANVILDEVAAEMLDKQSGELKSGGNRNSKSGFKNKYVGGELERPVTTFIEREKTGGASRFFYVAKASKRERNAGLEGMPLVESGIKNDSGRGFSESDPHKKILNQNFHPTVKPVKLMEYLIKLVTPKEGTVLDPFMGSGSTGVAAKNLGFKFIGIEVNPEYVEIAEKRIMNVELEASGEQA